jgi:hypothetical protein
VNALPGEPERVHFRLPAGLEPAVRAETEAAAAH